ncbi:protein of unknown function (DUF3425) domain containing protein [Hyaloscypha variabilis]
MDSRDPSADIGTGAVAGTPSTRAKQPSRRVSLLTPEALARKRAQDRDSQRQTRLRVKHTIADLEGRVEELTQQLIAIKLENDSLKASNQLTPIGAIPLVMPPDAIPIEPFEHYPGLDAVALQKVLQANAYGSDNSQFPQPQAANPLTTTELMEGLGLFDPTLLQNYPFEDYVRPSIPVWQARPLHYPPTCRQDKILLNLIEERKLSSQTGGNDSELSELSDAKFPAVAPLLNPQNHASTHPLTASIVSNIIYYYSLDNFPQQIGLLYLMSMMTRWYISGSKEDYYALPEWLRPGAAQIVTAHPVWVDFYPWPATRERLCRDVNFHDKFEELKNAGNATTSVNWPYNPADCLISSPSDEIILNPVFISHIRELSNWSFDPSFFEIFPEFEHDAGISKCGRGSS